MFIDEEKALDEGQEGVVDPTEEGGEELDSDADLPDFEYSDEDTNLDVDGYEQGEEADDEPDEEPDDEAEPEQKEEDGLDDFAGKPEPKQTPEENSAFAKLRRKQEELDRREEAVRQFEIQKKVEEEMLNPEQIFKYAEENGITEEMAQKFLKTEAKLKIRELEVNQTARARELEAQREALKDDPLYKEFAPQVEQLVQSNPQEVDVNVALQYIVGKNREKLSQMVARKAEQKTLANVQDKLKRRGLSKSEGSVSSSRASLLTNDEIEMSNVFGTNPQEIAKYVKQESRKLRR